METAVARLYNDYKNNDLYETLRLSPINNDTVKKENILRSLSEISEKINISKNIIELNNSVSPSKQQNLYDHLIESIQKNGVEEYLPLHPLSEFKDAHKSLKNLFARSLIFLKNNNSKELRL